MKDEIDDESGSSRRDFIKGTAGVIAAGSALGLMGAASTASAAVASPEPEAPDTSIRWKTKPGELYNEKLGNYEEDVTGWKEL